MNFKAVLFDMDGVLVDSEPGYNRANREFFRSLGLPFTQKEITATTGSSNTVIASKILEWYPDLGVSHEELSRRYTEGIFRALKSTVADLIPGTYRWIRSLSQRGVKLAIGSSSTAPMVMYVADTFGLTPLMDAIVTCEDVTRGKPYPDIFLTCSRRLEVDPAQALVVEDSKNGILAAAAAGCPCAAFTGTNRYGIDLSAAPLSFPAFDGENFLRLFGAPLSE